VEQLVAILETRTGAKVVSTELKLLEDRKIHRHTSHLGFCSATAIAQEAVPNPHSRILLGRVSGGKRSLLSNTMSSTRFIISILSISSYTSLAHAPNLKLYEYLINRLKINFAGNGILLVCSLVVYDTVQKSYVQLPGSLLWKT
jgi:hypothetical protein